MKSKGYQSISFSLGKEILIPTETGRDEEAVTPERSRIAMINFMNSSWFACLDAGALIDGDPGEGRDLVQWYANNFTPKEILFNELPGVSTRRTPEQEEALKRFVNKYANLSDPRFFENKGIDPRLPVRTFYDLVCVTERGRERFEAMTPIEQLAKIFSTMYYSAFQIIASWETGHENVVMSRINHNLKGYADHLEAIRERYSNTNVGRDGKSPIKNLRLLSSLIKRDFPPASLPTIEDVLDALKNGTLSSYRRSGVAEVHNMTSDKDVYMIDVDNPLWIGVADVGDISADQLVSDFTFRVPGSNERTNIVFWPEKFREINRI